MELGRIVISFQSQDSVNPYQRANQTNFGQQLRRQSPECWQCFLQSPLSNQLSTTCFKSGYLMKKIIIKIKEWKKAPKSLEAALCVFFFGFFQATEKSPAKIPIEFHYNYHVFLVFGNYLFSIKKRFYYNMAHHEFCIRIWVLGGHMLHTCTQLDKK